MARRNRRARRTVNAIEQLEWRNVVNAYSPINVLDDEQVQTIINSALDILETNGMRFLELGSRTRLASAGADVDEESMMVRFDRSLVMEQLALAPPSFELRARNPDPPQNRYRTPYFCVGRRAGVRQRPGQRAQAGNVRGNVRLPATCAKPEYYSPGGRRPV
jgi:trimethylamine:corrinoid methyltransferase-like protein